MHLTPEAGFGLRAPGPALLLGLALLLAQPAQAARVLALSGEVLIERGAGTVPVVVGSRLREGDQLRSGENAEVFVRFDDGAKMVLRSASGLQVKDLRLKGPSASRQKTIRVLKGALRYISSRAAVRSRVSFETSTATIGIRGTDIEIAVSDDPVDTDPAGTYLKVNSGTAIMEASDGTLVEVDSGQIAYGGLPEVVPRGIGGKKRPAARKLEAGAAGVFKSGLLDSLMN